MTTSLPDCIAWPLLAFMATVVAVRFFFYARNQYDTYLNHTLALLFGANLLRDRTIENALADAGVLTITTSQQLSLVAMIFTGGEFIGFVTLWSQLPLNKTRRRQRVVRIVAVLLAVGFWAAAHRARVAGLPLEVSGGWDGVLAWVLLVSLLLVLAVQFLRMAYTESVRPEARRPERLLAAGAAVLGVAIAATSISAVALAVLEQLGWVHSIDYRLHVHGVNFFYEAVAACMMASVPWLRTLTARAGLDPTSRRWRRLQPLCADMTAAVPESAFELKVHNAARRKTTLDLHQTTVQIRDALLRLRPYFHDLQAAEITAFLDRHSVSPRRRDAAVHALQLAHAVSARAAGVGVSAPQADVVVHSRSTTLDQEAAELLRLAHWWPRAQTFDDNWTQQPEMST